MAKGKGRNKKRRASSTPLSSRGLGEQSLPELKATLHLERKPLELTWLILNSLPIPAVLTVQQICRYLRDVISGSHELQYDIELYAVGMVDTSKNSSIPPALKLAFLKTYEHIWHHLAMPQFGYWNLQPGARLASTSGWLFIHDRRWRGRVVRMHSFVRHLQLEQKPFTIANPDEVPVAYYTDFAQDLLVLLVQPKDGEDSLALSLQLRSTCKPERHPLATVPSILIHRESGIAEAKIRGRGDLVALMTTSGSLRVWNWKTGKCILYQPPQEFFIKATSIYRWFEFLDGRHIFICLPDGILIYELDNSSQSDGEATGAVRRYIFRLPPSRTPRITLQSVEFSSHEGPSPALFCVPSDIPLLAFKIPSTSRGGFHLLFVSTATLLSCIASTDGMDGTFTFPWEEWGPKGSRMVRWTAPTHDLRTISVTACGWKVLLACNWPSLTGTEQGSHGLRLELFDFAPGAIRDSPDVYEVPPPPPNSTEPVTQIARTSTTLEPSEGMPFKDAVTTALPCRHVMKTVMMDAAMQDFILTTDGYMILDERSALRLYSV